MLWEAIAYLGLLVGLLGFGTAVVIAVQLDRQIRAAHPQYRRGSR